MVPLQRSEAASLLKIPTMKQDVNRRLKELKGEWLTCPPSSLKKDMLLGVSDVSWMTMRQGIRRMSRLLRREQWTYKTETFVANRVVHNLVDGPCIQS